MKKILVALFFCFAATISCYSKSGLRIVNPTPELQDAIKLARSEFFNCFDSEGIKRLSPKDWILISARWDASLKDPKGPPKPENLVWFWEIELIYPGSSETKLVFRVFQNRHVEVLPPTNTELRLLLKRKIDSRSN